MQREKQNRKQKSNEEYRRDIFTLKQKIKQEQEYLQEIKQKCSQVDIFSEHSYTFQMKIKILENDYVTIKDKIERYSKDEHSKFYQLNFCVYALSRACQIVGLTPEMVYRSVDILNSGNIKVNDFFIFLRQVLRMDSNLFNPIIAELDPQDKGIIELARYTKMLKCFMIDTELELQQVVLEMKPSINGQNQPQISPINPNQILDLVASDKNQLNISFDRICIELERMQILPITLFKNELVNVATTAGSIKNKLKNMDNLDCVAVYLRCDPIKEGAIESDKIVRIIEKRIETMKNFESNPNKKLKLQSN